MEEHDPLGGAHAALIRGKLVESLYAESMLLADEARAYFETHPERAPGEIDAVTRIGMSCEWLKTTTRLMHVIAWLLTQRAVNVGELTEAQARLHDRMLGEAIVSDPAVCRSLPDEARLLIAASEQLFARALRLQEALAAPRPVDNGPARALMARVQAMVG